jgi:ribosomal protein S18 acetylase RimI-like enzyme
MTDTDLLNNTIFRRLQADEPLPRKLLLDADPCWDAITKYLESSEIYIALLNDKLIASVVLYALNGDTLEIKNIAVTDKLQGKGIGRLLLEHATRIAVTKNLRKLVIGTSNASIGQLCLYQKAGFDIKEIKQNFFLDNYPEPIFENGIRCRHMIMLEKQI